MLLNKLYGDFLHSIGLIVDILLNISRISESPVCEFCYVQLLYIQCLLYNSLVSSYFTCVIETELLLEKNPSFYERVSKAYCNNEITKKLQQF